METKDRIQIYVFIICDNIENTAIVISGDYSIIIPSIGCIDITTNKEIETSGIF